MTKFTRKDTITHAELHEMLMAKPGFKGRYEALEPEYRLISEMIRARNERNLTQGDLAKRMGTKQSAIARFERGGSNPTLDFMQRLARALNLKLDITVH